MGIKSFITNLINPGDRKEEVDGMTAVKIFSTDTEPKLADYPRGQYQATWETVLVEVPGGWGAIVRFFGYAGSEHINEEHQILAPSLKKLKPQVDDLIRSKMATYKR